MTGFVHVQEPDTPPIQLPEGGHFQPRGAWTDIHEAICNARHLIYIAGWSIYDKITLIRDSNKPMSPSDVPTLGALACSIEGNFNHWVFCDNDSSTQSA